MVVGVLAGMDINCEVDNHIIHVDTHVLLLNEYFRSRMSHCDIARLAARVGLTHPHKRTSLVMAVTETKNK